MSRKAKQQRRTGMIALVNFALLVLLAAGAPAAARPGTTPPGRSLATRVAQLVASYEKASKAVVGVSAVDLRDGETLVAIRRAQPRIPASNQKILTSAFILARFGGAYNFVTGVYLLGDDVVVVGGYDPTLGDPILAKRTRKSIYAELDSWAGALSRAVGRRGVGDILLSSPAVQESYMHPDWPKADRGRWYVAPACAVNFHDNCLDVYFRARSKVAEPVVAPRSRFIRIVNEVKLGRRNIWSMRTNADDSVVTLRGSSTGRGRWPLSVPINDPPLLLGRVLAERLIRAGVKVEGRIRSVGPIGASEEGLVKLAETATPLAGVMARANKRSLNMAAEAMLLRAGDGTWRGSARMMAETLAKSYGLEPGKLTVSDGCGLSRKNRVTPEAMTKVLAAVAASRDAEVLLGSLPIAGVDGTLQSRLAEARCRGRVAAKTGYILGVCGLSGYVLDKSGSPAVAFSILANDVPAGKAWQTKNLQDAICRAMVDWLDK